MINIFFRQRIKGRVCQGVKPDQKINFYAKISLLNNCEKNNLIAVSVGIYGYNTVSAIFVTPLCGCDCENPRYQVTFFLFIEWKFRKNDLLDADIRAI